MIRVFVAAPIGPLDEGRPARLAAAIDAGRDLLLAGFAPFVPHVWAAIRNADDWIDYDQWITHGFAWLDVCHVVLRLPGESPGADREVARAHARGIPVFDSVEAVTKALIAEPPPRPAGLA